MLPLLALLFVLHPGLSLASTTPKNQLCLSGIQASLDTVAFTTDSADTNQCLGRLRITSLFAAAKLYCTDDEILAGHAFYNEENCKGLPGVTLMPYPDIASNLTESYIRRLKVINYQDVAGTTILEDPVLISEHFFIQGYTTIEEWDIVANTHKFHGFMLYVFWAGIVLVGTTSGLLRHSFLKQPYRTDRDLEGSRQSPRGSPSIVVSIGSRAHHWIKTNLVIPATVGPYHHQPVWWCAIPTRIESVVVLMYCILTIILAGTGYRIYGDSLYFDRLSHQVLRFIADRAGIMALSSLPILWLFSGRNSILLWITGWHFATFNLFHKTIARMAVLLGILHGTGYTVYYVQLEAYTETFVESWLQFGAVAVISMSLILGFSTILMRRKYYDLFLVIHITLSIVVVIALFYHVSVLETEYHPYIWTLVAVWCFERFARFVRLAYCNMHLLRSPNRACLTRTTATYQREANVIRLEVVPGSETLRPAPGQHYFIYQPMKFRGYENHAFSLASWSVDNEIVSSSAGSSGTLVSPGTKVNDELDLAARPIPENPHASGQQQSAGNEVSQYKFVFLIRPFAGWTRRLCDECLRSESSIDVKVLLEGPYGNRAPIHNYENALFIAGGTGIAAILPYIQDHLRRISPNGISTRTRSIKLIWSTKESGFVREVALKELLPALGHEDFAFDFFTTSASESSECSDIDPKISRPPHVKIIAGRPDIRSVIHDTVVDVRGNDRVGGRIAVMVSGPAGMADTARQSVHQALKAGNREIDYYEETFGW